MFRFFRDNKEEFMKHYHKRSNAESVFSMMKRKYGSHVRGKCSISQENEVLCKALCHNICDNHISYDLHAILHGVVVCF